MFSEDCYPDKIYLWFLDRVPMPMRTWPWLRKFYWQKEDFDRADKLTDEYMKIFKDTKP